VGSKQSEAIGVGVSLRACQPWMPGGRRRHFTGDVCAMSVVRKTRERTDGRLA
jgi:hypothetical protein